VRVPAGQRQVQLDVGEGLERIDLGEVRVRAGQVTIASARMWRETPSAALIAAVR
jgi:hypothetical protein